MDRRTSRFEAAEESFRARDESRLAQVSHPGVIMPSEHLTLEQDAFGSRTEAFVFPILMSLTSVFLALVFSLIAVKMGWHLLAQDNFVFFCVVLALSIASPLGVVASFREYRKWRSHQAIRSVAALDPLTGLLNRRAFSISIDEELRRPVRGR